MLVLHSVLLSPSLAPTFPLPHVLAQPEPLQALHDHVIGCWNSLVKRVALSLTQATTEATLATLTRIRAALASIDATTLHLLISTSSTRDKKDDFRALGLGTPSEHVPTTPSRRVTVPLPQPDSKDESLSSTSSSDIDEDLLSSPPLSPALSQDTFPSPPPSPTFDSTPSFPATETTTPRRSSAYLDKVSYLDSIVDYVSTFNSDLAFILSTRAHGMAFIEAEESYELRYDARRFEVQDPAHRAVVMGRMYGSDPNPMPWVEADNERLNRFQDRFGRHMEDYLDHLDDTPSSNPSRFRQGPPQPRQQTVSRSAVRTASTLCTFSLPAEDEGLPLDTAAPASPPSTVELSSLRTCLDLPPPPAPTGRQRAVYRRYGGYICEEFPLRSLLIESLRAAHGERFAERLEQKRYREWAWRYAQEVDLSQPALPTTVEEEEEDEAELPDIIDPAFALFGSAVAKANTPVTFPSSPIAAAPAATTWADIPDEDETTTSPRRLPSTRPPLFLPVAPRLPRRSPSSLVLSRLATPALYSSTSYPS